MYTCFACTYVCALCAWSTHRGQEQLSNALNWRHRSLWAFLWVLDMEPWFYKRNNCSNCWTNYPAPFLLFSIMCICVCLHMGVCGCESMYPARQRHQMLLGCSYIQYWEPNSAPMQEQNVLLTLTAEHFWYSNIHNLNNSRTIPQVNKCNKDRAIYEVQMISKCWKDHIEHLFKQADSPTGK